MSGPSYIYGKNMSVINNTQCPESTMREKRNLICYHAMRESIAIGESLTTHITKNIQSFGSDDKGSCRSEETKPRWKNPV